MPDSTKKVKQSEIHSFNREKMLAIFGWNFEFEERCKGVHCVDLGESFPTSIYLQKSASIQPRTSSSKLYSKLFNIIQSCPYRRPKIEDRKRRQKGKKTTPYIHSVWWTSHSLHRFCGHVDFSKAEFIFSNGYAFAMLANDGTITCWGAVDYSGLGCK